MKKRKPRGPKPKKVSISQKQGEILERLIKCPSTTQRLAQRARIVKQCASDARNQHIADDEKVTVNTVKKWRSRWLKAAIYLADIEAEGTAKELEAAVESTLADKPRSGTPPKFTAEQVCQIIAVACEPPEESGRPITEWTPRELADEAVKRDIVSSISPRQAGRFLKASRSKATSQSLLAEQ
jgi:putative transposase